MASERGVMPLTSRTRSIPREGEDGDRTRERKAIAAAKAGDWDALTYLYSRYSDDVCRFVQSIVNDHHQAEAVEAIAHAERHPDP